MDKNKEPQFCENCGNSRKHEYKIRMCGRDNYLCKTCWLGFMAGFSSDYKKFLTDENAFNDNVKRTQIIDESAKK